MNTVPGSKSQVSGVRSAKPLPDESNREDIEQMLLHAVEFWMSNPGTEEVKPMRMVVESSSVSGRTIHTLNLVEVDQQAGPHE